MEGIIGVLDKGTLHAELVLPNLKPIERAYWNMVHDVIKLNAEKGSVQVFYPGPVIVYERRNGSYNTTIFRNGGIADHSEQFYRYLILYAQGDSSKAVNSANSTEN